MRDGKEGKNKGERERVVLKKGVQKRERKGREIESQRRRRREKTNRGREWDCKGEDG